MSYIKKSILVYCILYTEESGGVKGGSNITLILRLIYCEQTQDPMEKTLKKREQMKMPSKKIKAAVLAVIISILFLAAHSHASTGVRWDVSPETGSRAKVAEISGGDAAVYYNHGNGYYETGDSRKAVKDFNAAITLNPAFAEAYYGRGRAYLALGDHVRAVVDLSTAIALKPGFARAYYERGLAYYASGNKFQAERDFRKAAELGGLASSN